MDDIVRYVTRDELRVTTDREEVYIGQPEMGQWVTLSPGEAREVRDSITDWLDHLEDEADLRALDEARANDDGTRIPLRDFKEEADDDHL